MAEDVAGEKEEAALRESTVESVLEGLRGSPLYWRAKQLVKTEVIKREQEDTAGAVAEVLRSSGLFAELRAVAHERVRQLRQRQRQLRNVADPELPLPPLPVPLAELTTLSAVEWARTRWAQLALSSLRDLSREQRQPLLRPRREDAAEEVTTRHVLDLATLYTLLTTELRNHASAARPGSFWGGSLGVVLHTASLPELRSRYQELVPSQLHLGIVQEPELLERRQREGQQLLRRAYAPEAQAFARFGCPAGLRCGLWSACLLCAAAPTSQLRDVARGVGLREWLTDDVLRLDVAEHCANDLSYFPFDEIVEAMVLALSRDDSVPGDCECGLPQVPVVAGPEAPRLRPLVGSCNAKVLPDGAITASSVCNSDARHGLGEMWRSRLDNQDTTWCAGSKDKDQWIQWDFGSVKQITRVQTKGRAQGPPQWVSKYTLEYAVDKGGSLVNLGQTFVGNSDVDSLQDNELKPPILASRLRLRPVEWHGHIALRAEIIGCSAEEAIAAGADGFSLASEGGQARSGSFVPPCGVVPFRGFSYYACPIAFLADRLEVAYPLFRALYCRHLCRLHTVSCQPATLLPLCALFESLVFTTVPHVAFHLGQLGPEAAPLRAAFPWIVRGFVGFLRAEQVLLLWDRIVGFGSVELVAVLAAAIFVFRAQLLLSAQNAHDVELVLSDISSLQTMPLLQGFLFADELNGPSEP